MSNDRAYNRDYLPACSGCGVPTASRIGMCTLCQNNYKRANEYVPDEADALAGGEWVNVGGIQKWRPKRGAA